MEAKANLSAFSGYLEHGEEWVKKFFPQQHAFVMKNKNKSYTEIVEMVQNELPKL